MTTYTLYLAKPAKGGVLTANQGVYQTPVAQGLTINDANILTDNPGLLGNLTSLTDKPTFLKRWLRRYEDMELIHQANGLRCLLSSDGGTTFLAAER